MSLLAESSACRAEWKEVLVPLLVWGSFAGLFGSLVCSILIPGLVSSLWNLQLDSVLGATVQRTKYSVGKKLILTEESPVQTEGIRVISGMDILSNNQVCSVTVG